MSILKKRQEWGHPGIADARLPDWQPMKGHVSEFTIWLSGWDHVRSPDFQTSRANRKTVQDIDVLEDRNLLCRPCSNSHTVGYEYSPPSR